MCGVVPPANSHSESLLAEVLRILKPSGRLIMIESTGEVESVMAKLKLNGYVNVKQVVV